MVTVVLAATGEVAIVNVPVKLLAGAVTVAGTLATAGLLLDSADQRAAVRRAGAQHHRSARRVPADDRRGIRVERSQHRRRRSGPRREAPRPRTTRRRRRRNSRRGRARSAASSPGRWSRTSAACDVLLLAHQRRGEGARIVDLNRVRRGAGGDAPLERDRLRRRFAVGGREQRRRGRAPAASTAASTPVSRELGDEAVAPEDQRDRR